MLSRCLLTKISASELSGKFIRSVLLVGQTHVSVDGAPLVSDPSDLLVKRLLAWPDEALVVIPVREGKLCLDKLLAEVDAAAVAQGVPVGGGQLLKRVG